MSDPYWAVPIAGGMAVLGLFGARKLTQRRNDKLNMLPANGLAFCSSPFELIDEESQGRLTLVGTGTGGLGMLSRTIDYLAASGRLSSIGAILICEFDEPNKLKFLDYIATHYPELVRRIVYNEPTEIPGGFQARTWDDVCSPLLTPYWVPQVNDVLSTGADLIRATEKRIYTPDSNMQVNYQPAVIKMYDSPGSHAAVADMFGKFLHHEFPLASIYMTTFVSKYTAQKREFQDIMNRFQTGNYARIFTIGDMIKADIFFDHAESTFISAIWTAPLVADRVDSPWNCLAQMAPHSMNEVGVLRVFMRHLPVKMTAGQPPRYFVFMETAVNAVIDGLREIENKATKTIALSTPKVATARFVTITLPLQKNFLLSVKDKVEEMLKVTDYFTKDPDRHLIWTPTSQLITPTTKQVNMTITKMEIAKDGVGGISQQVAGMLPPGQLPEDKEQQTDDQG
jgi:hypothetical protein